MDLFLPVTPLTLQFVIHHRNKNTDEGSFKCLEENTAFPAACRELTAASPSRADQVKEKNSVPRVKSRIHRYECSLVGCDTDMNRV